MALPKSLTCNPMSVTYTSFGGTFDVGLVRTVAFRFKEFRRSKSYRDDRRNYVKGSIDDTQSSKRCTRDDTGDPATCTRRQRLCWRVGCLLGANESHRPLRHSTSSPIQERYCIIRKQTVSTTFSVAVASSNA